MKMIVVTLMGLSASASFANDDICIARKQWRVAYGSSMNYIAKCNEGSFETEWYSTGFLIPIPVDWNNKGHKRLLAAMTKKQLIEVGSIQPARGNNARGESEPILIFEKEVGLASSYCTVLKYNVKETGIYSRAVRFDAIVACQTSDEDINLSGVTEDEISRFMDESGYVKALETDLLSSAVDGVMPSSPALDLYKAN